MLLLHVMVALIGIFLSGFGAVFPSRKRLHATYAFIAFTLASGSFLVISTHSAILSACMTGLGYLAVTLSGAFITHRRLAHQTNS
jgi:hypothetical membrane protein